VICIATSLFIDVRPEIFQIGCNILTPPPYARPQLSSIGIQQLTKPFVRHFPAFQVTASLQECRRPHSYRLKVDVQALELAVRRLEDLVHEANVLVLLERAVPPPDCFAVQRAVSVGVHGVDAAPVADEEDLVGAVGVWSAVACLAED